MSKHKRGFACIDLQRRREISSLGGRAAQKAGTAHRWTPEEAIEAGRKGGRKPKRRPNTEAIAGTDTAAVIETPPVETPIDDEGDRS